MEDEPTTEILDGTYRALCKHGYADLTLQDIAAEADRSKASIHYHYESKQQLFVAFFDFLFERYTDQLRSVTGATPRERLYSTLEVLLTDTDGPQREFQTAMPAVTARAPYDDELRERLAEFDTFLFERLREIMKAGVSEGEFEPSSDPSLAAEFLATTITGAHTRQVAVDHPHERLYAAIMRHVGTDLIADERPEVAR